MSYVELRAVDVNPYSSIGIDENTAGFLEALALYCLLKDSPNLYDDEQEVIEKIRLKWLIAGEHPMLKC